MNSTPKLDPEKAAIPPGTATIIVEAAGVSPPLTIRVRRALKYLGRTHGLRCIRCDLPREETGGGK